MTLRISHTPAEAARRVVALLAVGTLTTLALTSDADGQDDDGIIVLAPCPDGQTINVKWGEGLPCNPDGDNTLNIWMPRKRTLRFAVNWCADHGGRLVWSQCRDVDH
jgi:hypothetical protein